MSEQARPDPEIQKLVEQTIRYLVFVAKWLARRFNLERLIKTWIGLANLVSHAHHSVRNAPTVWWAFLFEGIMDILKLVIGGVAIIPLVVGLVEFSKRLNIKGNVLLIEAFFLGAIFTAVAGAISLGLIPILAVPWIQVVFIALAGGVAGAATTGLYDLAKGLLTRQ